MVQSRRRARRQMVSSLVQRLYRAISCLRLPRQSRWVPSPSPPLRASGSCTNASRRDREASRISPVSRRGNIPAPACVEPRGPHIDRGYPRESVGLWTLQKTAKISDRLIITLCKPVMFAPGLRPPGEMRSVPVTPVATSPPAAAPRRNPQRCIILDPHTGSAATSRMPDQAEQISMIRRQFPLARNYPAAGPYLLDALARQ